MGGETRDHVFISYASEDYELAEWLTLKLTAEGYKVWCDRIKLLGGESYPRDIDRAIKDRTFRLLALLSRSSIGKPNPVKERTLALNIGRDRGLDFLIPLNVDGLSATELDWMTSDLTFIPFHRNWAAGFAQLLKKLDSIGTPRGRSDGRASVRSWFNDSELVVNEPETLWTNLLEVTELPGKLLRVSTNGSRNLDWPAEWPIHWRNPNCGWVFDAPAGLREIPGVSVNEIDLNVESVDQGVRVVDIATILIKQQIVAHCLRNGMLMSANRSDIYFPPGLLPKDRLNVYYSGGKKTWVLATGERTFRKGGVRERCRYHLAPVFRPMLKAFHVPIVKVQVRVHLTDVSGRPLDAATAFRRRKAVCKSWWNREWLSRLLGIVYWLAEGQDHLTLADGSSGRLVIAGMPIRLGSDVSIDEKLLAPIAPVEDTEIIDEEPPSDSESLEGHHDGIE